MKTLEIIVVILEQAGVVCLGVASLAKFGRPWRRLDVTVAWMLWLWITAGIADGVGWILLALGHPAPVWAYLLVFALADVVMLRCFMLIQPLPPRERDDQLSH